MPTKDSMKGYCTWLPAMMDCLLRTTGPVLEIGSGYGTPILAAYCDGYRQLTTVESDPEWFALVVATASPWHLVYRELPEGDWDVALVDAAPASTRQPMIEALRGRVRHIVVHDVEDAGYRYDFAGFDHVALWDDLLPHTAVLTSLPNRDS